MVLIRVRRSTTDPGVKTVQDKRTGRKGAAEIPGRQAKEDRNGSCADTRVVGPGTALGIVPKGLVRIGDDTGVKPPLQGRIRFRASSVRFRGSREVAMSRGVSRARG